MSYVVGDLFRAVRSNLAALGWPAKVRYGQPPVEEQLVTGLEVWVDRAVGDDNTGPKTGTVGNPRAPIERGHGIMVIVRGRSQRAGATSLDHDELVSNLADAVLLSVDKFCRIDNRRSYAIGALGFVADDNEVRKDARFVIALEVPNRVQAEPFPEVLVGYDLDAVLDIAGTEYPM